MPAREPPPIPRLVLRDPDAPVRLLSELRRLMARHPAGTGAVAAALVAEGRRFAATPEGARWQRELSGTELVRRGRMVWEALGVPAPARGDPGRAPSDLVRETLTALGEADLEALLTSLLVGRGGDGLGTA